MATDWAEYGRGTASEVQTRKVLADLYHQQHGEALKFESIRSYLGSWLDRKLGETARGTFARYKGAIRKFLEFLADRAERSMSVIQSGDVLAFRNHVADQLSTSSANTDLKILRIAFGQAWRDGIVPVNPVAQIGFLKSRDEGRAKRRPFTVAELKKLISEADDEWRGIIRIGFYTGQRLGDLVRLRWCDIDTANYRIQFQTSKTGRVVLIPLEKYVLDRLVGPRKNAPPDAPLFPKAFAEIQKANGDTRRLSGQFYELLVKCSLAEKRAKANTGKGHTARRKTNPLSFHCLRHTTTSELKNTGATDAIAGDIVGFDTEAIAQNYTHIAEQAKRTALGNLPDIG